ncbi:isoamyl acetate-hydrolyzing esterase [Coemansia interrupta]|uniref:Isoamyl acetate-hydrolyzing esterase n=1 Tax=Coemansia interrupta TaxID=1126814 RepID=A0A9W8LIW0_9FUNG|nr:isoamyl acetate-hydrolyzing esterase [Coemansia interrupta]
MSGQIVCLGDSITQRGWEVRTRGWVAQLAEAYVRTHDVVNRGFGGYTTRWAVNLLPRMLPASSPRTRLVTILFGANDAQLAPYKQHVPLDEFERNLHHILDALQRPGSPMYAPQASIVLITPPVVGEEMWEEHLRRTGRPMDRRREVTREYAEAVVRVARERKVVCVDLWAATEKIVGESADGYAGVLVDGLHLNAAGNDLLFGLLSDTIRRQLPHLDPATIPLPLPHHSAVVSGSAEEFERYLKTHRDIPPDDRRSEITAPSAEDMLLNRN